MKSKIYMLSAILLIAAVFLSACSKESEVKETPTVGEINQEQKLSDKFVAAENKSLPPDIAVSVDGSVLKKAELDKQIKEIMKTYQDQIPKDKIKEVQVNIKTQLVESFIMRTVLENEFEKRKIVAPEKEVQEAVDRMKAQIEPGQKLEEFLKANKMTAADLNKNIASDIKTRKIILMELGGNAKPTSREISKFYNDNKERFIIPESVNLRHILIAINEKDDDKIKAEKKEKIERLRRQIVEGADFAEIAVKNSDCPSKESGGDLGAITKGQTVKPFEDAAFSQKIKEIGPVIATDYGYHIIQVTERNPEKKVALDDVRDKISGYLEQQKQTDAFAKLMEKLRAKADIRIN